MYFLKKLFEKYFENNEPTDSKSTDNKNGDSKKFTESRGQLDVLKNDCENRSECADKEKTVDIKNLKGQEA